MTVDELGEIYRKAASRIQVIDVTETEDGIKVKIRPHVEIRREMEETVAKLISQHFLEKLELE